MVINKDMAGYYAKRTREYEKVYEKPERHEDIHRLAEIVKAQLEGHDVLEIAGGTGFWTQHIAETAWSILLTDINKDVIEVARSKKYSNDSVQFKVCDVYEAAEIPGSFSAGFCGFWWSHVLKSELSGFLCSFHDTLSQGSRVVFIDNNYVEGSNTPIYRNDEQGNTYQLRRLLNGSEHEVLKNFPSEEEVLKAVGEDVKDFAFYNLQYYWCACYTLDSMVEEER